MVLVLFVIGEVIFSLFVNNMRNLASSPGWSMEWTLGIVLAFLLALAYLLKYLVLVSLTLYRNKQIFNETLSKILRCKLGYLQSIPDNHIQ